MESARRGNLGLLSLTGPLGITHKEDRNVEANRTDEDFCAGFIRSSALCNLEAGRRGNLGLLANRPPIEVST